MANLLRRIRVELPITTFHGWHLADALIAAMFYSFARVSAVLKELVSYCAS